MDGKTDSMNRSQNYLKMQAILLFIAKFLIYLLNIVKNIAQEIEFSKIKFTTPEKHDSMIAFISQIPHVLVCAYVLSLNAKIMMDFLQEVIEMFQELQELMNHYGQNYLYLMKNH